jgi:CBS domain-containing protein
MKIKEIMAVDPETLDPEDSIEEAAQVLSDADVGCAPVVSNEMVLGVLTDRDIVVRAVAEGQNMKSTKVQDILTPGAIHCYDDDEISTAAELMAEHQIRRIIVVTRDNRLAGVLSLADIASYTDEAAKVLEEVSKPSSLKSGTAEFPDVAPNEAETSMRGAGVSETGERPDGHLPIDSLVRGELSAVETYKQALAKVGHEPIADELRRIELEHEEAVDLLFESLRRHGKEIPRSSGLWGTWSKAVEGTAKIFGGKAAIKALKEGEEHGLHDYEDALKDEVIDPEVKALIRSKLLPQTRAHIPALDRVLQTVR